MEKKIANHISDKGLIARIYFFKTPATQQHKKETTQFENGQRTWINISPKKIYKWSIST